MTHLSTESKVFFSGGGRALIFLGIGPSLSVCGGGRVGSEADGRWRGEEGRVSFHPPCEEKFNMSILNKNGKKDCSCAVQDHLSGTFWFVNGNNTFLFAPESQLHIRSQSTFQNKML